MKMTTMLYEMKELLVPILLLFLESNNPFILKTFK
jgi:hypothetical protein